MTTNSHSKIVKDIESCQIIILFDIFAAIIVAYIIQFISSLWGPIFMLFASEGEVFWVMNILATSQVLGKSMLH